MKLGLENQEGVKQAIIEIYDIAKSIAPINKTGTDSINKDWRQIFKMAQIANGIVFDYHRACHEAEQLQLKLNKYENN